MRLRALPSGTRRKYLPVGSTAASLPLTVPEGTTHIHVTVGRYCPGLLRSYTLCPWEVFPKNLAMRDLIVLRARLLTTIGKRLGLVGTREFVEDIQGALWALAIALVGRTARVSLV
jgi:hypothetical protein